MTNPIVAADGYSYEEKTFLQYLSKGNTNSPMTGLPLKNKDIFHNQALKVIISEWKPRRQSGPSKLDNRDANSITQRVREEFQRNADLLHSAKGKDIVAFLGNTGAGKSTLVNLLAGKEIKVSKYRTDYVLVDPSDKTAMVIGTSGSSETLYPKSIDVDGLCFFDLPGFNDTDGSERNLVNAAFTRQILMDAASVRLVFVAGEDQFTADRSASVRQMFNCIKQLFVNDKNINLVDEGVFVATKITCPEQSEIIDFLLRRTDSNDKAVLHDQLKFWNENKKISCMFHPLLDSSNEGVKNQILKAIKNTKPAKIVGINVSVLYPPETKGSLERMFLNILDGILDRKIKTSLTTVPEYDKAIAIYTDKEFWQKFDNEVCSEDEAIGLLKEFCINPYNKAFKNLEKENEVKCEAYIKDLINKRQERVAYIEGLYREFFSKMLDSKIKTSSTTVSDYDKAIALYTDEVFWQEFNTDVYKEDDAINLLKELGTDPYKAFKNIEGKNEAKRRAHIEYLMDKKEERIMNIEQRTEVRTKEVISALVPKKQGNDLVQFDFAYHKDFYDEVCGVNSIKNLATDPEEQEIVRRFYAGYISYHSHEQMMLWYKKFSKIEELTKRVNLLEAKNEVKPEVELKESKEELIIQKVQLEIIEQIIPLVAKGYEEIYQRFFKGELIYRPKGMDKTEGEIRLRIADLKNPLEGRFDLSKCGDAGDYLSINTGYRKGKKEENANKVEIWLTPRFLVEKEQSGSAKHLQGIMGEWNKEISVGVLYTWGGWDNMSWFEYNITTSKDLMSKKNLYEIYEKSELNTCARWGCARFNKGAPGVLSCFVHELK